MIEYILIGTILGIIAGLIPGLHTNNIALIVATLPILGEDLSIILLTTAIVQTFVEFIPSTYLGAPTSNTFEGVLPAHKMLLEGNGREAVFLSVYGGIIGMGVSLLTTPIFFLFLQNNKQEILLATPIILTFAIILMILSEETKNKKIIALFVTIAAATQGMLFTNQIFPLISGYFGLATLLYAIKDKNVFTKQIEQAVNSEKGIILPVLGSFGGAIVALMPGIGSNTAARIIRTFLPAINEKDYLKMIGAINTANFFFGYATLFAINKTRNGAMIVLQDKITLTQTQLVNGIIIMVIATGIGAIVTLALSKKASELFNESKLIIMTYASIILIIILVLLFNGVIGLICLFFATALGLFVNATKVKRSLCMNSLIVPVLFFYLFTLL